MSIPETNLQLAAMAKEEARIRFTREANMRRTERFLNARQRTMGVDVDALNAQVAEKRQAHEDTNEAARMESKR